MTTYTTRAKLRSRQLRNSARKRTRSACSACSRRRSRPRARRGGAGRAVQEQRSGKERTSDGRTHRRKRNPVFCRLDEHVGTWAHDRSARNSCCQPRNRLRGKTGAASREHLLPPPQPHLIAGASASGLPDCAKYCQLVTF